MIWDILQWVLIFVLVMLVAAVAMRLKILEDDLEQLDQRVDNPPRY
jgi:hypothetical protein